MILCFGLPAIKLPLEDQILLKPILLGLILIPLINVPFDWASTGLTRKFLKKALQADATHLSRAKWALADFIIALIAMVLLCMTMVFALEAFNAAARLGGYAAPAPVAQQIAGISNNPYNPAYFWIYFALFTTLLPTALHALIWLISLCGVSFRVNKYIAALTTPEKLAGGEASRGKAAIFLSAQWTAAILTLSAIILIGIPLLLQNVSVFGDGFLHLMEWTQRNSAALFA